MQADRSRRPSAGGVLAAIAGLGLFVYFLQRAGVGDVVDGVRRLGLAFVAVVALGGLRFVIRSAAWLRCLDGPHRLRLSDLFQAAVVGDALSNLTPLSIIVGEPAKGMFLRSREPLGRTLPALAVENLFYTLSALFVITGGLVAVFLLFQTSGQIWVTTTLVVMAMVGFVGTVHWIIWNRKPVGSTTLKWLQHVGITPHLLEGLAARVERVEDHIYALYPRDRKRLGPLAVLELSFHVVAILEIYLVLSIISDQPPTLLHAFVFESTNRFISFAFRFVPLRIGVDEASTGMFANLLAFGTTTGVTLAIIRKGRILVWIGFGVLVLVRRGLSLNQILGASRTTSAADAVVIVIMARSPIAGDAPKTRLAGAVGNEAARRRLYGAFLRDTIAACRTVARAVLRVAYTPDSGTAGFDEVDLGADELIPQRGQDLGQREAAVFADLFASGFSKVVMLGSDLPTVPMDHIRAAIGRLDTQTVVLGPSEDGGYYVMALANSDPAAPTVPDLFSHVRWSTPAVLEDTKVAAERTGLRVELVPSWYDVDDEEGLARLRRDLVDPTMRSRAPETATVLDELFEASGVRRQQKSHSCFRSPAFPPSPCAS